MTDPSRAALADLTGAMRFVLAFYEPGQRHLDTEAWKCAEAGARSAFKNAEAVLNAPRPGRLDCGELASHLDRIANKQLGLTSDIAAVKKAAKILRALPGRLDCGELASHLDRIANKQLGLTSDIAAVKKAAKILRALPGRLDCGEHDAIYLRGWNEAIASSIELLEKEGWYSPQETIRPLLETSVLPRAIEGGAVNDAMVEAGAIALHQRKFEGDRPWAECASSYQEVFREGARTCLEAALSHPNTGDGK